MKCTLGNVYPFQCIGERRHNSASEIGEVSIFLPTFLLTLFCTGDLAPYCISKDLIQIIFNEWNDSAIHGQAGHGVGPQSPTPSFYL